MPKKFSATGRAPFLRTRPGRPASLSRQWFEPLEGRTLFSVALDANGFTVVTPEGRSRVVYVSSSLGSDGNNGLSPTAPVQTLDHAESLLRDGQGDQMLLARGDVWHETLGEWTRSGRSAQEPMVIGAYGAGARPRIDTGARTAFSIQAAKADVKHVSLMGLQLIAGSRVPGSPDFAPTDDGSNGLRILSRVDDLLVEDCVVQAYANNIILQDYHGPATNVTVRRSYVLDAYTTGDGHSQGLYAYGANGLLLEGNLFDHNGWSETVPGAPATIYNHNVYLSSNNGNVTVRDNVIANASSHGLQARSGGRIENNLFLDNAIGMTFGVVKGASVMPGGVSGVINGNVFLGTHTINGMERGGGMEVGNTRPNIPTVVSNNIFADADVSAGADYAIFLSYAGDSSTNGEQAAGLNDVTVQGNIVYKWTKGLHFDSQFAPGGTGRFALNRVTVRGNDFQQVLSQRLMAHDSTLDGSEEKWSGNRYDAAGGRDGQFFLGSKTMTPEKWLSAHDPDSSIARAPYAEPGRTADSYAALVGLPSRAALLAEMRNNSSQLWRPQFTAASVIDYVRAGFAEPDAAPRDWRAPTAPIAVAGLPATPTAGDPVITFTVTYGDDKTMDLTTFDGSDVSVVGHKGKWVLPASVVSVDGGGVDGQPVVVTYSVAAPDGTWDRSDRGKYTLVANERQVFDGEGFFVPTGNLEAFKLKVAPRPKAARKPVERPPTVTKASFNRKGPQSFTAWFSSDVSGSISADDLVLRGEDGATTIDPSVVSVSYDAARHAATWSFPGLPNGTLPPGRYHATLLSAGITDAAGRQLDGDRDGAAGGDYVLRSPLRA